LKIARHPRVKQTLKPLKAEKLKFQRVSVSAFQLLTRRLAGAEETLRAIRSGEVDTVMVAGKEGSQVFTLEGAEHAYRVLIECMNEGALTLTIDKMILYANRCFARMVKCPLEQVMGGSFRRFLSAADGATLRPLLKRGDKSGAKIQVLLNAVDGSQMPAQISIRPLAKNGAKSATFGLVVTDMTEARRNEEMLRTLTHRVVEAQEAERGRVALELHDNITQLLCAVLVRWAALANKLPARSPREIILAGGSRATAAAVSRGEKTSRDEVLKLSGMLGQTVDEVQRIARNLRPSVLDELGLIPALRATCTEFAKRTGVSLKLACKPLTARLPAEGELALYRILQKALENVEKHARAHHVTVRLRQRAFIQLTINDDGIGFDPEHHAARRKGKGGLGLLSMRERATYVGGAFKIKSVRGAGTEIEVLIPLPPSTMAAN
jgi:two-component system, NarL family, sensor kinase